MGIEEITSWGALPHFPSTSVDQLSGYICDVRRHASDSIQTMYGILEIEDKVRFYQMNLAILILFPSTAKAVSGNLKAYGPTGMHSCSQIRRFSSISREWLIPGEAKEQVNEYPMKPADSKGECWTESLTLTLGFAQFAHLPSEPCGIAADTVGPAVYKNNRIIVGLAGEFEIAKEREQPTNRTWRYYTKGINYKTVWEWKNEEWRTADDPKHEV
ncbi:hypothetical protein BGW36DRAFT_424485 [Talaromyces proteolyticus]|uniref:Uncharacterized protein n=1 Tax=Talaromyces proteolyticus TaxID=1131652 RepID=A0AAD4Q406_9EURO|nr:uncharacterized protein BGW36DRAFT_424485 [Talaromyces proteolyticus]KAH8702202.1 hypothetical protein BGW36DRAFT_424485 [Talaromyces proteolyticus]